MRTTLLLLSLLTPALTGCMSPPADEGAEPLDWFRQDLGPGGDARLLEVRIRMELGGYDQVHATALLHLLDGDAWLVEATDVRTYTEDASGISDLDARMWMTCDPEELGRFYEEPGRPERDMAEVHSNVPGRCLGLRTEEELDALLVPVLGKEHGEVVSAAFDLAVRAPAMEAEVSTTDDGGQRVRSVYGNETLEGELVLEDGRVRSMHFAMEDEHVRGTLEYTVHYGDRRPA